MSESESVRVFRSHPRPQLHVPGLATARNRSKSVGKTAALVPVQHRIPVEVKQQENLKEPNSAKTNVSDDESTRNPFFDVLASLKRKKFCLFGSTCPSQSNAHHGQFAHAEMMLLSNPCSLGVSYDSKGRLFIAFYEKELHHLHRYTTLEEDIGQMIKTLSVYDLNQMLRVCFQLKIWRNEQIHSRVLGYFEDVLKNLNLSQCYPEIFSAKYYCKSAFYRMNDDGLKVTKVFCKYCDDNNTCQNTNLSHHFAYLHPNYFEAAVKKSGINYEVVDIGGSAGVILTAEQAKVIFFNLCEAYMRKD